MPPVPRSSRRCINSSLENVSKSAPARQIAWISRTGAERTFRYVSTGSAESRARCPLEQDFQTFSAKTLVAVFMQPGALLHDLFPGLADRNVRRVGDRAPARRRIVRPMHGIPQHL